MESRYFKHDISRLSFSYWVLLEARDDTLPLYEHINFMSICSSSLGEFYKIHMTDCKATAAGTVYSDEESIQSIIQLVTGTSEEVNRQLEERIRIHEQKILLALRQHHIIFYQSRNMEPFHKELLGRFFRGEVFPYFSPVSISKDKVISFLCDNRLYLAVRLHSKGTLPGGPDHTQYSMMKLPYSKVPHFIGFPKQSRNYYLTSIEDIIKASIDTIFPDYDVDSNYCIRILRDADILINESVGTSRIIEQVKAKVRKRKVEAAYHFVHNRAMPDDFLDLLADAFHINRQELIPSDKHLNIENLRHLPNPNNAMRPIRKPQPMRLTCLNERESIFRYVEEKDLLLHHPHHPLKHFVHFLCEVVHEPTVHEIMVTWYHIAENSAVVDTLMTAVQNDEKVVVFVEPKARFDEENGLATVEMMKVTGVDILFSLPGLKVHAKVALALRHSKRGHKLLSYAYIDTGNLDRGTAILYADYGSFTYSPIPVNDLHSLFRTFQSKRNPVLHRLLVARFNLIPEPNRLIDHEVELTKSGKQGRIILKMNTLQSLAMVEWLYEASQTGVKIDLIVRGTCYFVPGRKCSHNIRAIRTVDTFLEHAHMRYFGGDGKPKLLLDSSGRTRYDLHYRIEAVAPVLDPNSKRELPDMFFT